jgi:PKD repeat protein
MGPLMYRFSYDDFHGFRITWDLGLSPSATKNPSKATVSFWITTQNPKWGIRATAEKYYALNPSSFSTPATALGAWVLGNVRPIASVPDWEDFGWAYHEQDDELNFDNNNGIQALHYLNPTAWGRDFPQYQGDPEVPYDVLMAALTSDLTSTKNTEDGVPVSKMARSVFDTAPFDENGLQQVHYNGIFFRGSRQYYPMLPDPEIPNSRYGIAKQYSVDARITAAKNSGNTLHGIFLDNIGLTFANVENYRKSLWAYLDTPLSFSYDTRRVTAYSGDPIAAFCGTLRTYLHGKGMILMASSSSVSYSWFAHLLDVAGGESQGDDPIDKSYTRLALSYRKPWSNLFVPPRGDGPPTAAEVAAYLREALFFGFYPGMNGVYWDEPSAYERDRGLFQKYVPLIDAIAQAGWEPVNYALSSEPAVFVERFGHAIDGTFYFTAHNAGTSIESSQITLDGAGLGIPTTSPVTVKEKLSGGNRTVSRSGSNILFSETLDPDETVVYAVTTSGAGPEPAANFNFNPSTATAGQAVQFTDTSTNTPTSWSWNFGDPASGASNTSSARNPTHVYSNSGTFQVRLTAANSAGSSANTQSVPVVSNGTLKARFTYSPANPLKGQTVQFSDLSTGAPASWSWNFGDPNSGTKNTSTGKNPTHVFAAPGSYRVKLTVQKGSSTSLGEHTVTVK